MYDSIPPPCIDCSTIDASGSFEPPENNEHTLLIADSEIEITVDAPDYESIGVVVRGPNSLADEVVLWSGVCWCRSYGIPGVFKERYRVASSDVDYSYRLGGLYRYYGFELEEREREYEKYGETVFGT